MAALNDMSHMSLAKPGERFTYVFIPCDSAKAMEERNESTEGGLEDDKLTKTLKAGTELGPNIDITALTVPSIKTRFIAVSIYQNGNGGGDALPVNQRVMGLMSACGLKATPGSEIKGDCVLSRYADNDDDLWKRIDLRASECASDAPWVMESAKHNRGRSSGGASLSSILGQQAAAMSGKSGEAVGHPLLQGAAGGGDVGALGSASGGAGCAYTQTPDEVEVVAPLPAGATKKDVKIKFTSARLEIRFSGREEAVCGDLGGNVDVDGCTWTIDADGGNVVVSLEKRDSGKEWPFALRTD